MNFKTVISALFLIGIFSVSGCAKEKGPMEKAGESLDNAAESVQDSAESAADEVKKAIDD